MHQVLGAQSGLPACPHSTAPLKRLTLEMPWRCSCSCSFSRGLVCRFLLLALLKQMVLQFMKVRIYPVKPFAHWSLEFAVHTHMFSLDLRRFECPIESASASSIACIALLNMASPRVGADMTCLLLYLHTGIVQEMSAHGFKGEQIIVLLFRMARACIIP